MKTTHGISISDSLQSIMGENNINRPTFALKTAHRNYMENCLPASGRAGAPMKQKK
jgi:hypothetical protein